MSVFYKDTRLKIKRAEEHIRNVYAAILALENSCTVTVEQRPDGGQTLKHEIPDFRAALDDISLIVGDAVHNLRTALDFSWYSTIERLLPDKISDATKFPVRRDRKNVEGALHGIEVDTRCQTLFDLIMVRIQPYERGHNEAVWTLHNIDIFDKHLLLLDLDPTGYIKGIGVRNENGELYRGNSMPASGVDGRYIIDFRSGLKVEDKGKLSVAVTLQQAGIFKPVPITSLLSSFRNFAFYTVELLENVIC